VPVYEYRCSACGKTVEFLCSSFEEDSKVCPSCGGQLRRLISAPGLIFKGSGFYVNDYGRNSSRSKSKPVKEASKDRDYIAEARQMVKEAGADRTTKLSDDASA